MFSNSGLVEETAFIYILSKDYYATIKWDKENFYIWVDAGAE